MKFSSTVHSLSAGHSVTLKFSAVGIDKSTLFTELAEGFVVQVRTKNLDTGKYEWIESSDFTYGQVRSGQVRLVADKESFDPLAVKNLQLSTTHGEVDFAHTISVTSSAKFVSSEGERNGKPTLVINDADIHFGLGTKAPPSRRQSAPIGSPSPTKAPPSPTPPAPTKSMSAASPAATSPGTATRSPVKAPKRAASPSPTSTTASSSSSTAAKRTSSSTLMSTINTASNLPPISLP